MQMGQKSGGEPPFPTCEFKHKYEQVRPREITTIASTEGGLAPLFMLPKIKVPKIPTLNE